MYLNNIKKLKDLNCKGKKVLLRTDYNVPLSKDGKIVDDFRIKASLKTIKQLFKKGASQVIIISHLGRPKGKDNTLKLDEIAKRLLKLTSKRVEKLDDCINIEEEIPSPTEARIVVLENLRFYEEEEKNDEGFAKKLSGLADVYVNDAFGVCHRKHASVHAITKFLPSCIGLLIEKELEVFEKTMENPERPFYALLGGSKLETKIPAIRNLIEKVDKLYLGGAMVFTFYKAEGLSIGKSLYDKNSKTIASLLMNNEKLIIPDEVVIAEDKDNPSQVLTVRKDKVPSYMIGLDVGDGSIDKLLVEVKDAKTIIWNGPFGYYENDIFARATLRLLKSLSSHSGKVIIGGGDTASLVERTGLREKFYHVSTGGGASMKLIEGSGLLALDVLLN